MKLFKTLMPLFSIASVTSAFVLAVNFIFISPSLAATPVVKNGEVTCNGTMNLSAEELTHLEITLGTSEINLLTTDTYGSIRFPGLSYIAGQSKEEAFWKFKHPFGDQIISKWGPNDTKIAARTRADETHQPVFMVGSVLKEKRTDSEIYYTGKNGEMPNETIVKAVNEYLGFYEKLNPERHMDYLEIFLSTPEHDAIGGGQFVIHPISPAHFEAVQLISEQLGVPVSLNLISPNGYAYRTIFFGNENKIFEMTAP